MRLSKRIQAVIKNAIEKSFGDVTVYLFGSRVDDSKKGGDIDLAIDADISQKNFKENKIKFITEMVRAGFDLKIDVVDYNRVEKLLFSEINGNNIRIV